MLPSLTKVAFEDALTWGDDYELCFTVPKHKLQRIPDDISKKLLKSNFIKLEKLLKERKSSFQ